MLQWFLLSQAALTAALLYFTTTYVLSVVTTEVVRSSRSPLNNVLFNAVP